MAARRMSGPRSTGALPRLIRREMLRRKGGMLIAAACMLGTIGIDMLAPWPLKIVIDHVLLARPVPPELGLVAPIVASGTTTALIALAAVIACLALLSGVFAYLQGFLTARIGHEIVYALRHELFARLAKLSLAYHSRAHSGELLTRVASDTNIVRDAFVDWSIKAISETLLIIGVLAVMLFMNWQLALVVATTLPLLFFVMRSLSRRIRQTARTQRRQDGRLTQRLNEALASIALIQAFGRESYELQRFDAESVQGRDAGVANARVSAAVSKAVGLAAALASAATVLVGGMLAVRGRISPGDLLIFVAYVTALFKPIRDLGKLTAKFTRARVSAERLGEILALEPEISDAPGAVDAQNLCGEIVFDDVCFAYGAEGAVLASANLRIEPGEHVAIVGTSGAGKSTLLRLIVRLYEPHEGEIRIDGRRLDGYTRDSLRREIGVVLQDAVFVGATVGENIAYGRLDATMDEIERAARLAGVHEFVAGLPAGYESVVGERGCTLSGGQRQRICLARTLIRDPSILILDEPTSAVDPQSAAIIERAIVAYRRGRTTIVIGHQFASLEHFDRVVQLSGGRIADITGRSPAPPARRLQCGILAQ